MIECGEKEGLSWPVTCTLAVLLAAIQLTALVPETEREQEPSSVTGLRDEMVQLATGDENAGTWRKIADRLVWGPSAEGLHAVPQDRIQRARSLFRLATDLKVALLVVTTFAILAGIAGGARGDTAPPAKLEKASAATALGVFVRALFLNAVVAGLPVVALSLFAPGYAGAAGERLVWFECLGGLSALALLYRLSRRHPTHPLRLFSASLRRDGLLGFQTLGFVMWGDVALAQVIAPDAHAAVGSIVEPHLGEWLAIGFGAVVVAPVVEELLFRWLLYSALRSWAGPLVALVVSSGVFGLAHADSFSALVSATWFGLVTAFAFGRSQAVGPLIVAHMTYNVAATLAAVATGT
jgi:membrane protease YdiL (CAAX protease family)